MEFKNNPTLGNETSEVKIRQLEDKIKTLTQNIGDLQTELNYLHNDFEAENVQINSLPNAEVIESDKAIGYNAQGKLIPIDVTAGTAKWETVEGRANAIKPKNNAEVIVDTVLKLQNATEETLTGSMVLSLDEAGNVIKVNMLDVVQKKLTEGYNITISADGVISCDIKTMTFKGSVSTFDDLPETGNTTGDVWNVTTTNQNYCWDGENWIVVGSSVDLTNYYTKTQTDSAILSAILNKIYPVGSVKISENNVNPGTYITGTTWILKSSGRVLQGADDDHAGGTEIAAGLPNITGAFSNIGELRMVYAKGALKQGERTAWRYNGASAHDGYSIELDAAAGETDTDGNLKTDESTKVFGKSNTVQPSAYVVYIWKRTA